jgi:stage V sporulation protein G
LETANINIGVYPIKEPKGNTLAFASITINNSVTVRGIRVVRGKGSLFVCMPQSKDRNGVFHDTVYLVSGELRHKTENAIIAAYNDSADTGFSE